MQRRHSIERMRNELNLPITSIAWSKSTPELMFRGITESDTVPSGNLPSNLQDALRRRARKVRNRGTVYSQPSVNVPKWMLSQSLYSWPQKSETANLTVSELEQLERVTLLVARIAAGWHHLSWVQDGLSKDDLPTLTLLQFLIPS